ncbi:MAG TPA: hypothetical protein VFY28_03040 [Candidatus Paceibacterota bacterium]|nr:hypothetical protein [Candidatus Paceibacterota bacterium]
MFSFNQLIAGIALIVLVGVGAFFYRNAMERPLAPGGTACTADAKLCPDGSAVGRQGPNCEFTACPFPNIEVPEARIGFALPTGYTQLAQGAATQETLRLFTKPSLSPSVQHSISVKRYLIPEGQTAEQVILANTRYQPADMNAEDFSRFATKTINGKNFRTTAIERFEALVQSSYFLVRGDDVLRFDIVEHDVTDWMSPELDVESLPEHAAFLAMLATLQVAP